jgi:hypothetical protein
LAVSANAHPVKLRKRNRRKFVSMEEVPWPCHPAGGSGFDQIMVEAGCGGH